MSTIYEGFRDAATRHRDKAAILVPERADLPFGRLLQFVDSARSSLHEKSVGRHSRVGAIFPDRAQAAVAHLVCVSTCVSLPMNPALTPDELRSGVINMGIEALLVSDQLDPGLLNAAQDSGVQVIVASSDSSTAGLFNLAVHGSAAGRWNADLELPDKTDISVLLQTSGTSARPKIVPQTQLSRVTMIDRISKALKIGPNDRCVNVMPMHHTSGLTGEFLAPMLSGAAVVFVPFNPTTMVDSLIRYQATWFSAVPTMHQAIVESLNHRSGVLGGTKVRFASARHPSSALCCVIDLNAPTEYQCLSSTDRAKPASWLLLGYRARRSRLVP